MKVNMSAEYRVPIHDIVKSLIVNGMYNDIDPGVITDEILRAINKYIKDGRANRKESGEGEG